MSKFTDFLNLFMWDSVEDSEEEFDIDKALNDNWEKVDTKLKTHITNVNKEIKDFEEDTSNSIKDFKEKTEEKQNTYENNITKKVNDLKDTISSTQVFQRYSLEITENKAAGAEITLPCNYKVGQDILDVYLDSERLALSTDTAGSDGHYLEVGTKDSISNKIKSTSDWNLEKNDVLTLVVRGDYNDTES